MARQERFGKFVLLEELGTSGLGTEYRAAKLGPSGLDRIVSLVRVGAALSANAEFAKALMDQAKLASQLQSPSIVKVLAIGRVESAYYLAYEHLEGKSLKSLFGRARRDAFPFAVDHALLIASRVCAALEYAHGKRLEGGGRYFHGLLVPDAVVVSYDGDVRLRGFGFWPSRLREAGGLRPDEAAYLAPEQLSGPGDARSDIYATGALLFEALTGQPLNPAPDRASDTAARVAGARLSNPQGENDALPAPVAAILTKALAPDPAARYADVAELRKSVDALLFSGEFNPTTFNLAFFMHSLFRDEQDREAALLAEAVSASYAEYLSEPTKPATPAAVAAAPAPAATAATAAPVGSESSPAAPPVVAPAAAPAPHPTPRPAAEQHRPMASHDEPAHAPSAEPAPPVAGGSARDAAAGLTFHKEEPKGKAPLLGAAAVLVLVAGAAGWYFLMGPGSRPGGGAASPAVTTLSPEAAAALAKVKELEDRLKAFEDEKAAAQAKAAEEAKKKVEAQAAARGQAVDPAAVQKAQDEARKKAQAEAEKKQQEERRKLEEQKAAEESHLAEEKRRAEAAAVTTTTVPTTLAAAPPPTTQAPAPAAPSAPPAETVKPGTLVNLSDNGVIEPRVERQVPLEYPAIARQQRVGGTVELSALVDEKGEVAEVKIVKGASGVGLNQAAVDNVRRRRYRPATKDGVPVKVYVTVLVTFDPTR